MLGDFGFRSGVSGKVAPSGPLTLDKGHWAGSALGHGWVFNQTTRVVDLVTGAKGRFMTTPTAANRVVTRWGPGYQTGVQGESDFIATLQAAADCKQGNIAIALGMSNYTPNGPGYDQYLVREPTSSYTYGSTEPVWTIEGDTNNLYFDNGNVGGISTGNDTGIRSANFASGRDGLNILIITDNGTAAGTKLYHNGADRTGGGGDTLVFGTAAASNDSIQIGNNYLLNSPFILNACVHFVYVFKRALSTMEVQSLNSNPYQFWVPENIQVRFPVVSATGVAMSLTGVAGTTAAGVFSKTAALTLPYALSPALLGTLTPQASETLAGNAATAALGSLATGSVTLSGLAGTTAPGTLALETARPLAGNAATAATNTFVLGNGTTLPGASVTASLGALTAVGSLFANSVPAAGVIGTIQAQGSLAQYLLGLSSSGSAGGLTFAAGSSVIPVAATASGATGTAAVGISPTIFGNGGTGRIGFFSLAGTVSDVTAPLFGNVASGAAGSLSLNSKAVAQATGTVARTGVGILTAGSPGVWSKPRFRRGVWVKEF